LSPYFITLTRLSSACISNRRHRVVRIYIYESMCTKIFDKFYKRRLYDTVVVDRDHRLHSRRSNIHAQSLSLHKNWMHLSFFSFFFSPIVVLYYSHIVSAAEKITRRVKKGHVEFIVFLSHAYYVSLCVYKQYNSVHCTHTHTHTRYSICIQWVRGNWKHSQFISSSLKSISVLLYILYIG